MKNENYDVPEIRIVKPVIPDWLCISKKENMYSLVNDIDVLKFLVDPTCVEYEVFEEI